MIKNIDHIAVKVTSLTQVCQALENLGITCKSVEEYDEVGMRIAFLDCGETAIELLEVTNPSSPIAEDPPGLHHVGVKVKNIEETYEKMKNCAHYKLDGEIRRGAHSRIFFFKITGLQDTLFECVE